MAIGDNKFTEDELLPRQRTTDMIISAVVFHTSVYTCIYTKLYYGDC